MKNKDAFTLIELLAVIVILSIIALIATPFILNVIKDSREESNMDSTYNLIKTADLLYAAHVYDGSINYETNLLDTLKVNGDKPDSGYLMINKEGKVAVGTVYDNVCYLKDYNDDQIQKSYEINDCKYEAKPNAPVLNNGLVAVNISDDGSVSKANTSNNDWYDYSKQKWANAVVLEDENLGVTTDNILAYYVWIPRYEYLDNLEPGIGNEKTIEINFIKKNVTNASEGHVVPPGFTFGEQELSGLWVAKFEPSNLSGNTYGLQCENIGCEKANYIRILPNKGPLAFVNVATSFYASRTLETVYNLKGDSHMMKNSEWATVAYLSHSKYGINSEMIANESVPTITGARKDYIYGESDQIQSTTGNITGVYDMSCGFHERVMATYSPDGVNGTIGVGGFVSLPEPKYYDLISQADIDSNNFKGYAMNETARWYSDGNSYPILEKPWVIRGLSKAEGIFSGIWSYSGDNYATGHSYMNFRPVLTPLE